LIKGNFRYRWTAVWRQEREAGPVASHLWVIAISAWSSGVSALYSSPASIFSFSVRAIMLLPFDFFGSS
jgi:hypothetical protein